MAISVEQFIERLTESGLLSAADVSQFQDSLPPDKRPKGVQQLAQVLVQHGKLTKYQAQAVYQGKTKGLVFGQYVVLDKLGEGGMGVVLKAQHRRMKRTVAIKVLSSAAMKQAGAVERFHREVEAAAKLEHPNIVAAYDADEHEGVHYLAMQYVEGKDLATVIKDHGPLGIREAVECILQAARGLQYAHGKGIVHRDIKPGNLLLDKEGTVKVLDMGLARIAGADAAMGGPERLTTSGQVMGTCDYMAPEQALDSHMVDARADIYALGCTLYRLLTGNPPYHGDSLMQILMAHQQAPIPSICQARPEVPSALDAVFQRMVAKKAEDRQQSMAEVIAELRAILGVSSGRSVARAPEEPSSAALAQSLAFLQENTPSGTLTKQKKSTAEQRTPPHVGPEHGTGSNVLGKAREAVARVRRMPLVLAGLAGGLLLLLGIVLAITLRQGTLVVEIDEQLGRDVQVAVSQGGEKVQLVDAKSGWTLSLSPGKYDLAVEGGDDQFLLDSHSITLTRGGQVKVKVTLKPPLRAVAPFDAKKAKKHQEAWARYLGVPVEITNSIGMKLVLIPPGEFMMGDDTGAEPEKPAHKVKITKAFYLGKCEVTQEEWEAVMGQGNNRSFFKGPKLPVVSFSLEDCQNFLKNLNEKVGGARGSYRLPTEAQWEYACRAGSTGGYCFGQSEIELGDYGWFEGNSQKKTHPVGQKKPNGWGLYDMHGNAWEWCADFYDKDYYKASPGSDPTGARVGPRRVIRGGGWGHPAKSSRSASREGVEPERNDWNTGFRVVCEPSAAAQGDKAPAPSALSPVVIAPPAAPPAAEAAEAAAPNTLTHAERAEGWQLLFDGRTTAGWRVAGSGDLAQVCAVDNGSLLLKGVRKYILSDRDFDNFELSLQWRVGAGGNSGILFHCPNDGPDSHRYSPEYQIVDNAVTTKATELAGSVFALYAAPREAVRAVGEWNDSRLVVEGKRVNHWLNGRKVVEYELGSPDFLARVANSLFQADAAFAQRSTGAIALQGWVGSVWFQNVKIRRLSPGSLVGADGKWQLPPGAPPPAVAPFDAQKAKEHQAGWAKHLGVPVEITNSVGMKLVLIPPGEFMMGSPKELIEEEMRLYGGDGWYRDLLPGEGPQHRARITKPYWLGVTAVTQEEYQHVMGSNPSKFQGDPKRPVEQVSRDDAVEFCRRLSELRAEKAAGRRYGLPTEAQWEYACRAGSTGRWCFSPQRNPLPRVVEEKIMGEYGWSNANTDVQNHPVAQKRANAWGLYDVYGNVWEWCEDWYDQDFYAKSPIDDPTGPPGGSFRVLRGGGWRYPAGICRSASRDRFEPGSRDGHLGLRACVVLADK